MKLLLLAGLGLSLSACGIDSTNEPTPSPASITETNIVPEADARIKECAELNGNFLDNNQYFSFAYQAAGGPFNSPIGPVQSIIIKNGLAYILMPFGSALVPITSTDYDLKYCIVSVDSSGHVIYTQRTIQ